MLFPGVPVGEADVASDSASSTSEVSEQSRQILELDDRVSGLKEQVRNYEEEIERFEILQADWLSEKETLEGVLVELRTQLKSQEEALNAAEAEKVELAVLYVNVFFTSMNLALELE